MPPRRKKPALKPISGKMSKGELVKRLQALLDELQQHLEADEELPSQVVKMAAELVRPGILRHKEAHVRLLAALCLAELLNRPSEMPFDQNEQRKILKLFVEELRGLQDPTGFYFSNYFSLLETLANTGAFRLCLEVGAERTVLNLFQLFFGIVSTKHSTKVVSDMGDILSSLIEDGMDLDDELLDILFAPLLPRCKSKAPAAADLSSSVLRRCVAQMQLSVHNYFNGLLGLTDRCESALASEGYDVIEAVASVDPAILVRVLPQLEHQLKMEDLGPRKRATALLGRVFGKPRIDAASQYRSLWAIYLGRIDDIHVDIRTCVCESLYDIITNYPRSLAAECFGKLHRALMDVDERARVAAAKVVAKLCESHSSLLRIDFLQHFATRRLDKKATVRRAALNGLASLFVTSINSVGRGATLPQTTLLGASNLVLAMRRPDVDDRFHVVKLLHRRVLHPDLSAGERARRLCALCRCELFSEQTERSGGTDTPAAAGGTGGQRAQAPDKHGAASVFVTWMARARACVQGYFDALGVGEDDESEEDKENDDSNEHKLSIKRIALAQVLPGDALQVQERLHKLEQQQTLKTVGPLLHRLCAEDKHLSALQISDIEAQVAEKAGAAKAIVLGMCILAAPYLLDPDLIDDVMNLHTSPSDLTNGGRALTFLHSIAVAYPMRLTRAPIIRRLQSLLRSKHTAFCVPALRIVATLGPHIQEHEPDLISTFTGRLVQLATETRDEALAKRAVQAAAAVFPAQSSGDSGDEQGSQGKQQQQLDRISNMCADDLDLSKDRVLAALKALGYVALLNPGVFAAVDRQVTVDFVVKRLLMNNEDPETEEPPENADEWANDPTVEVRAKVLGIKLLVRRLLGKTQRQTLDEQQLGAAAAPSIRILTAILQGMGNLREDSITPLVDRSRLRLAAGCAFLKLAQDPHLKELIDNRLFRNLAALVQDSCVDVRSRFCVKLERGLSNGKLPLSYMAMFVLSAIDPEEQCREQSAAFLRSIIKKRRRLAARQPKELQPLHLPEYVLPYAVHLIAHHPDFSLDDDTALHNAQRYLDFLFNHLCTRGDEEYSFLKSLVDAMKLAQDAHAESSDKLHAVCDLAMLIIVKRSSRPGWTLKSFPGDLALPKALFTKAKTAIDGSKRVLPESFQLHTPHGAKARVTPRKTARTPTKRKTPKKSAASSTKPTPQPTRRNAARAAKKSIRSMADMDDEEIERQTVIENTNRKSSTGARQLRGRRSGSDDGDEKGDNAPGPENSGSSSRGSESESDSHEEDDHMDKVTNTASSRPTSRAGRKALRSQAKRRVNTKPSPRKSPKKQARTSSPTPAPSPAASSKSHTRNSRRLSTPSSQPTDNEKQTETMDEDEAQQRPLRRSTRRRLAT